MKYSIIFSLLFFFSVITVNAQHQHQQHTSLTPEQKAQKQTDHLQKKLGLTEDQKTKVYTFNLNRINQTKAIREKNKNSTDKTGSKEEFQKVKTDYDTKLNAILTADQQKTWAQLKADTKAKRDAHHQQKGTKQPPLQEDADTTGID